MKVAHVITGLERGGAEMMLYRLTSIHRDMGVDSIVFSLKSNGELKNLFEASNTKVVDLDFSPNKLNIQGIFKLSKELKSYKPDLVLCWMYHANLFGLIAGKMAGTFPIVWNIRNSTLDAKRGSRVTILVMKAGGWVSAIPDRIISCSIDAKDVHIKQGYKESQFTIIPNGYDLTLFTPNKSENDDLRNQFGIPLGSTVIGIIGRFDPQKDYQTFIAAASLIRQTYKETEFVMCGPGLEESNSELMDLINESSYPKAFHLIGPRNDIQKIHNMFDIFVLSSVSEAFPNVLAEAMACGTPCVSTDVGDAAFIIGDAGKIVPPQNPQAIADAVKSLILLSEDELHNLKNKARNRIVDNFSLPNIAKRYIETYEDVIKSR